MTKCAFCGKKKDSVAERRDPYGYEINDDKNEYPICDECVEERLYEI